LKRVVVDASVVVAGLFVKGNVRDVLLNAEGIAFCAPSYLWEATLRQLPKVVKRARIPGETVRAVLEDLLDCIEKMPPGVYASTIVQARRLAVLADALADEDYIALAMGLDAPIWTLDRDFQRVPGLVVLSTERVESLSAT
jgi:predicted nucleic acid-binding protein